MIFTGAVRTRTRKIFISTDSGSDLVAVREALADGPQPQGNGT
jgi:hypothetical protein